MALQKNSLNILAAIGLGLAGCDKTQNDPIGVAYFAKNHATRGDIQISTMSRYNDRDGNLRDSGEVLNIPVDVVELFLAGDLSKESIEKRQFEIGNKLYFKYDDDATYGSGKGGYSFYRPCADYVPKLNDCLSSQKVADLTQQVAAAKQDAQSNRTLPNAQQGVGGR